MVVTVIHCSVVYNICVCFQIYTNLFNWSQAAAGYDGGVLYGSVVSQCSPSDSWFSRSGLVFNGSYYTQYVDGMFNFEW